MSHLGIAGTRSGRIVSRTAAVVAVLVLSLFAQTAFAQNQPLNFGNNFFVTGDYVVAGAYGMQTVVNGTATGLITVPDTKNPFTGQANPGITGATSVPVGAQIVGALLYWETVESASILPGQPGSGQNGFFKAGQGPTYPISGVNLTGQNNVSWSNGGCGGSGTRIVRVYRADVRGLLPQDGNGNVLAGSAAAPQTYQVTVPSSSNGSPPITLGASLVIIYRVLSKDIPLNSIVIYDGAFGQANSSEIMTQKVQGFYDAALDATRVSRLTDIVGSGQGNKYQTVSLGTDPNNLVALPNLYGGQAAFPGWYGGWDNPTWTFDPNKTWINMANPVQADSAQATTSVVPSQSNQGCVVWGATIVSTTVNNPDGDGLLKSWKTNQGYCDVAINPGTCNGSTDPSWVDLTGAHLGTPGAPHPDIFVQLDYMCQTKQGGTNACGPGYSFDPYLTFAPDGKTVVQKVIDAFGDPTNHQAITLHVAKTWAIPETPCTDSGGALCPFPSTAGATQPGVVGWKGGLAFVKNQFVDANGDTSACTTSPPPANCRPRFQHGRKDSWHYALFAHALGQPKFNFLNGLTDSTGTAPPAGVVSQSGTTVTFYTSIAHGLVVDPNLGNGRVTISDAITNPNLNGTYKVTCTFPPTSNDCSISNTAPGQYAFTITIGTAAGAQPSYTQKTDPNLSVTPGKAGTASGFSDVGGADSLIALGNWPLADQTWNAKAGIFMHELGHSLGLTHGGLYYDNLAQNDYTPTIEANCKPNFLSVMNYSFAVDLLDNEFLDYAEESLTTLSEGGPSTGFTSSIYSDTAWYAPTDAAHAAARHCDGTPILDGANMIRMFGPTGSLSGSWIPPQDINFDGNSNETFHGHSDWTPTATSPGIDLRQIGATGSLSVASGPLGIGGGPLGIGGGPLGIGGGPLGIGGGPLGIGGGPLGIGGGPGEFTHETANSYARPPRNANAQEGQSPRTITVSWVMPIFGSPINFKIYRSDGQVFTVSGTQLSYPDTVVCNPGGYTYKVTTVIQDDITQQPIESQFSNATSPPLTGCYTNNPPNVVLNAVSFSTIAVKRGSVVPITWSFQDDNLYNNLYPFVNNKTANSLVAFGPTPYNNGSNTCGALTASTPPTTLLSQGTVPNPSTSTFNVSTSTPYLFTYAWNTTGFSAGCYYFKLTLDSTQSTTSTFAVPLK